MLEATLPAANVAAADDVIEAPSTTPPPPSRTRDVILRAMQKPTIQNLADHNIPTGMKELRRWLGWCWEWNGKKWTKPPKDARTGYGADKTDPNSWCSFDEANAGVQTKRVEGVGIALGKVFESRYLVGIDFDDCRDLVSCEIAECAWAIIELLNCYWEVSPSGTGIKVFCLCNKQFPNRKVDGIEFYCQGSYFTVTGLLGESQPRELHDATNEIDEFYKLYLDPPKNESDLSDCELAIKALDALDPSRADDYWQWLQVGMALQSVSNDFLVDWDRWSQLSFKYCEGKCAEKWKGFGQDDGLSVGSLIYWAMQDGWTPPPKTRAIEFARITSAELANGDYRIEFLIEDFLVAGQPLVIAGPQKSLKTSLLIDAAISLATGRDFLGKFKVTQPYRVAVMTGESGLPTIQETATRICSARKMRLEDCSNLLWCQSIPRFDKRTHLDAIERFLRANEIGVLFIDPAYLAMPGADAGNLMIQGQMLRGISDLCQRLHVTLVLSHHTKKRAGRDSYDPLELQDIAWAGFGEWARQWWLLNRREKYEPGTGDHKLWLSVGGSAGHSGLRALDINEGILCGSRERLWVVNVQTPEQARWAARQRQADRKEAAGQEKLADYKAAVHEVLKVNPQGMTKTRMMDEAGIPTRQVRSVFPALQADGRLEPCKVRNDNNNQEYDGWRLKDES